MPNILPENLVVQRSVPIYGITQLGLKSHPTGSSTLEALTTLHSLGLTNRFSTPRRSDPVVLATLLRQWQNLSFFKSGIPIPTIFTDALTQGWGSHMGDSQIAGVWTHCEHMLHINVLELRVVILPLNHWAIV